MEKTSPVLIKKNYIKIFTYGDKNQSELGNFIFDFIIAKANKKCTHPLTFLLSARCDVKWAFTLDYQLPSTKV